MLLFLLYLCYFYCRCAFCIEIKIKQKKHFSTSMFLVLQQQTVTTTTKNKTKQKMSTLSFSCNNIKSQHLYVYNPKLLIINNKMQPSHVIWPHERCYIPMEYVRWLKMLKESSRINFWLPRTFLWPSLYYNFAVQYQKLHHTLQHECTAGCFLRHELVLLE